MCLRAEIQVCSAVGPSTGLSQAVLSVGKYAPGPYTITTYAVDAHELQRSLQARRKRLSEGREDGFLLTTYRSSATGCYPYQVPISVDGRSTSYEVSPSFPIVSSASSLALASAFCSSQGKEGSEALSVGPLLVLKGAWR